MIGVLKRLHNKLKEEKEAIKIERSRLVASIQELDKRLLEIDREMGECEQYAPDLINISVGVKPQVGNSPRSKSHPKNRTSWVAPLIYVFDKYPAVKFTATELYHEIASEGLIVNESYSRIQQSSIRVILNQLTKKGIIQKSKNPLGMNVFYKK